MIEDKKGKYTPGQNFYYNLPFFCNPQFFNDPEIEMDILEYFYMTKFKMPIARSLNEANAHTLDIFRLISEEMAACEKRQKELNNGK